MTDHKPLDAFATECGTTDDVRADIELNPPEDGHIRRVSRIHDYWWGEAEVFGSTNPGYSIVPPGSLRIVLEPDADAVTRGWGSDDPLERGVYLDGRAEIGKTPPSPVEVDDDYLRFAADAALMAVDAAADPGDEVVAVSKNHLSLSFAVRGMDHGEQEYLVKESDAPVTYPPARPDELYYGFVAVRRFGTPYTIYTHAEVPRLGLEELNEEWSR